MSDQELLDALGVEAKSTNKTTYTPREERIIAGFEEIQHFFEEHKRTPSHGEDKDIFERVYATRLDRIREQEECYKLVKDMDYQELLEPAFKVSEPESEYKTDKELLEDLGVLPTKEEDVTFLKHVKTRAEVKAAQEIAKRTTCEDFDEFKPLFKEVQKQLDSGLREAKLLTGYANINKGDIFILMGQKVYVAEVGDTFIKEHGRKDNRLRVIYDNGTESDLLMSSLQVALYKDDKGRRIVDLDDGPLFSGIAENEDNATGTIYVLRSKSDHSVIQANREIIHKIGVTGGKVETRISRSKLDPTFLMADVEIVATYELFNINKSRLENLLHRFFENAQLDIQISDRFGNPIKPKEWFMVPLFVIDQVVEKIRDKSISEYYYDVENVKLTHI